MGKIKIQVKTLNIPPMSFYEGGEGPQLNRWVNMEAKRHVYQSNFERHNFSSIKHNPAWKSIFIFSTFLFFSQKNRLVQGRKFRNIYPGVISWNSHAKTKSHAFVSTGVGAYGSLPGAAKPYSGIAPAWTRGDAEGCKH